MINQTVIQQLVNYTNDTMINFSSKYPHFREGSDFSQLPAKDVFEEDQDLFINMHLSEANNFNHGHDFFEITYVYRGEAALLINNDNKTIVNQSSVCILNPNAIHTVNADDKRDIVINILIKKSLFNNTFFSLISQYEHLAEFFMSYFLTSKTSQDYLLFNLGNTEDIDFIIERLCKEYFNRSSYFKVNLRCQLVLLFTEIIRQNIQQINRATFDHKTSGEIMALYNYLSVNFATATLKSTADHFNYHPNYLSAFIKKHTGKNFSSIIKEIRLAQAIYYLTSTNVPINDISDKLGYVQVCNFYNLIKKTYNMTPSEYRQNYRQRY